MRINFGVRVKNPWFWIGMIGTVLTAIGIRPEEMTSWKMVADTLVSVIQNPYLICSVVMTIAGVLVDPTTRGMNDSERAMTYSEPYSDEKETGAI